MTRDDCPEYMNKAYTDFTSDQIPNMGPTSYDKSAPMLGQITRVSFELSNICNYSSVHKLCPLHAQQKKIVLPASIINRTLKDLATVEYSGIICFHIYNEPLIDPRLFMFIRQTREVCPNARVYILTNGFYLDQQIADELTEFGVWMLTASAYSKSEYDRLTKLDVAIPYRCFFSVLDQRINQYEQSFLDLKKPCNAVLSDVSIACTGQWTLCCLDWQRRHVLGDLKEERLADLIQQPKIRMAHEKLINGERQIDLCRRCNWSR